MLTRPSSGSSGVAKAEKGQPVDAISGLVRASDRGTTAWRLVTGSALQCWRPACTGVLMVLASIQLNC